MIWHNKKQIRIAIQSQLKMTAYVFANSEWICFELITPSHSTPPKPLKFGLDEQFRNTFYILLIHAGI